jgi:plasmid maintenance system killer protein
MLEDAVELRDLASPPGNRLEALKDDWLERACSPLCLQYKQNAYAN